MVIPCARNISGKRLAVRSAAKLEEIGDRLFEMWNEHWKKVSR